MYPIMGLSGGSAVKNWLSLSVQEMQVQSLGQEDPLEKEMATHSSILAWEITWTEEPGSLQSIGLQTVRYDLLTKQQQTATSHYNTALGEVRGLDYFSELFWSFLEKRKSFNHIRSTV